MITLCLAISFYPHARPLGDLSCGRIWETWTSCVLRCLRTECIRKVWFVTRGENIIGCFDGSRLANGLFDFLIPERFSSRKAKHWKCIWSNYLHHIVIARPGIAYHIHWYMETAESSFFELYFTAVCQSGIKLQWYTIAATAARNNKVNNSLQIQGLEWPISSLTWHWKAC